MWRKYWSGNTKKNIMSSLLVTKDEIIIVKNFYNSNRDQFELKILK